jgi:hypothetical protein
MTELQPPTWWPDDDQSAADLVHPYIAAVVLECISG